MEVGDFWSDTSKGSGACRVLALLGLQWGDEGKGAMIDRLAAQVDIVARCAGGSNAGHTVVVGSEKFKLHLLPSGVIRDDCVSFIGNGVVINLNKLFEELDGLTARGVNWNGRFFVSDRAHVLFSFHQTIDGLKEEERAALGGESARIGTTRQGIGPCYSDKAARTGLRVADLMAGPEVFARKLADFADHVKRRWGVDVDQLALRAECAVYAARLRDLVVPGVYFLHRAVFEEGKTLLIEGANGSMLDIDFGTYPYVTSSNCTIGGFCTGLGIPPRFLQDVVGVVKAYTTRVGAGAFPTELHDATGEELRKKGGEFGTTTGRPRRCGWIDLVQLRYSCMINGITAIDLSKLDVLAGQPELKLCTTYRYTEYGQSVETVEFPATAERLDTVEPVYRTLPGFSEEITDVREYECLPAAAKDYIEAIEVALRVRVRWVGVGPSRDALIDRGPAV